MAGSQHRSDQRRCPVCCHRHGHLGRIFGPGAPEAWLSASEAEREAGLLSMDLCALSVAGDTRYFVRGHLELPVEDVGLAPFIWSVWAEVAGDDLADLIETWDHPDRADHRAIPGRLASELPYRSSTVGLGLRVHSREPGLVPRLVLDPDFRHKLVHEQREGISLHRVAEFNRRICRGGSGVGRPMVRDDS